MINEILDRLERIEEKATARMAFGDAIHQDGRTIIPVARITYAFGFGGGHRPEDEHRGDEAGAGGGGAWARVKPVAVLEMDEHGTRIRPVLDVSRLILGGMALVAWNVFWISRTVRTVAALRAQRER